MAAMSVRMMVASESVARCTDDLPAAAGPSAGERQAAGPEAHPASRCAARQACVTRLAQKLTFSPAQAGLTVPLLHPRRSWRSC